MFNLLEKKSLFESSLFGEMFIPKGTLAWNNNAIYSISRIAHGDFMAIIDDLYS